MHKHHLFSLLCIVWMMLVAPSLLAQNVMWESTLNSPEEFQKWQVIDGNADDVTWTYDAEATDGNVVYPYHYTNGGDDWLISPAIVMDESADLMIKYRYFGSFYSEQMEVYCGNEPSPDAMQLLATHTDIKDQIYESYVFTSGEKGDSLYLGIRVTSLPYKQRLYFLAAQVMVVGSEVAKEYPNRVLSQSGLTLAATARCVSLEEVSPIQFAVFDGASEVTDHATIYAQLNGGEPFSLEEPNYSPSAHGQYHFYATFGEKSSLDAPLPISVMYQVPELLPDSLPRSSDFLSKALLLQGTGVDCGYCPNGIAALWRFYSSHEQAHRVVHLAHHSYTNDDPLYCPEADIVSAQTKLYAYPNMMVNFDKKWGTTGESTNGFVNFLNDAVAASLAVKPETAVALTTQYDEQHGKINVTVGVKPSAPGLFRLTVALLQDSVYTYQSGATSRDYYLHNSSLRAMSPADGLGAYLDCGRMEQPLQTYQYSCEFDVSDLVPSTRYGYVLDVLRHARVVAYVRRIDGLVDNVNSCALNQSVGYGYTADAAEPPIVGMEEKLTDALRPDQMVDVYDLSGVLRAVVQYQHFSTLSLPSGVYILRYQTPSGGAVVKRLLP